MRPFAILLALVTSLFALPAAAQIIDVPGRAPPPATTDLRNLWVLDLSTGGRVTIWLRPDVAPKMVQRIKTLTRQKFYDGLVFHRVIEGFMAQGGDPDGDGTGGSKLPNVDKEFNYLPHVRGAVAAARAADENSANSQFYIMLAPRLALDKKYTVFGRVIDGMQYVDTIERGEPPANPSRVVHAYIASDNPPPYQAAVVAPPAEAVAPLPPTRPRTPAPRPAGAPTATPPAATPSTATAPTGAPSAQ
ncbi:peptidylprolyl isomerase [Sphingomonas sp. CFBP 13720]|uniref:peptidylprolyl isomerase n=1 Tax=Sphingomonas sp. CFBP 13720 TaxID=2775302 RepID=UPI00177EF942|nr:peptidylprolyl isomerase [Sphingomonas sp. CFBP 13720]MBD8678090.1 peptidylprolyl isomerase [Sphingomonas sp. CFBP 13720]